MFQGESLSECKSVSDAASHCTYQGIILGQMIRNKYKETIMLTINLEMVIKRNWGTFRHLHSELGHLIQSLSSICIIVPSNLVHTMSTYVQKTIKYTYQTTSTAFLSIHACTHKSWLDYLFSAHSSPSNHILNFIPTE